MIFVILTKKTIVKHKSLDKEASLIYVELAFNKDAKHENFVQKLKRIPTRQLSNIFKC